MRPVTLDLNEVVGNMTRLLQRILGEDVALQATFAPGLPPVCADPGMLEQVVLNLAVNARDAMPAGGTLSMATSLQAADSGSDQDERSPRVVLTVRDNGVGMAPELCARIFEPFFTTKPPGKGTGLGLATVYGIVRQHGGTIDVQSTPGAGTSFTVTWPIDDASGSAPSASAPHAVPTYPGATVLVVEDEPAVRLLTAAVLEQAGYRVMAAGTGREALDLIARELTPVDVLVTDVVMPDGVTGPELARRVLATDPGLPIVFVSGYSPEATAAGVSLQDGVSFLQKPYQLEELIRTVGAAVARRRSARGS